MSYHIPAHLVPVITNVQRSLETARRFREATRRHITLVLPQELLAFMDGQRAHRRGEPGDLEAGDRYSSDMITRVAWRTGWMVAAGGAR